MSKEQSSRRFSHWTRILFTWSTTPSGIWVSKRRRRQKRYTCNVLFRLYLLWHLMNLYHQVICIIQFISLMTLIALILIIWIMTGPSRTWNCRSRVAGLGQKGGYCRKCWWIGRSVSPCHASWLAFLHPSGLPWKRSPRSRAARGARPVGDPGPRIESIVLLFPTNTNPVSWRMSLAAFGLFF